MIFITCFLYALRYILQRKLKHLNEWVTAFWIGGFGFIVFSISSLVIYFSTGFFFDFLANFESFDWFLLIMFGFISAIQFFFFTKALTLDNPVRLSIYDYFLVIFQFVFDIAIFNTEFSGSQIVGGLIILVSNVLVFGR